MFGKCGWEIAFLCWVNYAMCVVGNYAIPGLMRFSEGANFVIIVLVGLLIKIVSV